MKLFGESLDSVYRSGDSKCSVEHEFVAPNIKFERYVQKDPILQKRRYLVEDHDVRLLNSGFTAAPSPADYFDLMCKSLKNQIDDYRLESVVTDMNDGIFEFTNCAMQYTGTHLNLYMDVHSMIYSEEKQHYIVPNGFDWYKGFALAEFEGIKSNPNTIGGAWLGFDTLYEAMPELMLDIVGKELSELPIEMRVGKTKSHMYIPSDAHIWPLTFGGLGNKKYCINIARSTAASRGVRK